MTEPLQRFVQRLNPRYKLLQWWPLTGGVSAQVAALKVRGPAGQLETLVLHQYGETNFRDNPAVASDTFRLLQSLNAAGLAVPTPRYVDASGEVLAAPVLVTDYVEGSTELAPLDVPQAVVQLAVYLSRLHALRWDALGLSFLKPSGGLSARPVALDEALSEGCIRDVLEPLWPPGPENDAVLLHGDFWPGNALWDGGRLAAVIDWEDAGLGDPLADVGNARLELLFRFGQEAMQAFTEAYRLRSDLNFEALPQWDLCAALRPAGRMCGWGLAAETERTMRARHREFVQCALERLSGGALR